MAYTLKYLKPVWLHSEWIKGKDSIFYQPATNVSYWSFPAPPDDTVVASAEWLSALTLATYQADFDSVYIDKLIRNVYSSDGLSKHWNIDLVDMADLCLTYAEARAPERNCQSYYYAFSEPVCNKARNVCWINVDKLLGAASSGWRKVYQLQGISGWRCMRICCGLPETGL